MTALFLLPFLMQAPAAGQECSISGRVYSASTGAPLPKAHVLPRSLGVPARPGGAGTTTDAEGNFHLDHLSAGQYSLFADRNGYLSTPANRVSCGASDVSIKMTPQGMIYGKVIDDDGEAVPGAMVAAYRRVWFAGHRQLQIAANSSAQADGSFVLGNLPSANYYFSARGIMRPPQSQAFVDNYFPNTPDPEAAVATNLTSGTDIRGINLRTRSVRVFNIRGTATQADGDPATGIPLLLLSLDGANHGSSSAGTTGGAFEFRNVTPGNYVIQALPHRSAGESSALTAYVPVTVGDGDVDDVHVALVPGAEIEGVARLDDAPFTQNGVSITFEPINGRGINNGAQIKEGAFTFHNVAPTSYRLVIQNLLGGYYVKSIRFGGRSLIHNELDLSAGSGGTLEILLSDKPGSVSGTARNSNGDPIPGATISAWIKDDPEVHIARADDSGHFSIRNLAPGEYQAIGWEEAERGLLENPAFRAAFESQAVTVTLQEGSQENAELKLVTKAAMDAVIAKLP